MSYDPRSDLQGISAFVHSVEAGSFSSAALKMSITKAAVAKSVARLEVRLGARLLDRTTRSLNLTAEGQAYYESCVKVLEELRSAEALLASRHQEVSGRLRFNLPFSFGRKWVMPVLRTLAQSHPQLVLDVSFADRNVDLVDEGIDMVVRLGDPGDHASLIGRRIATQQRILCAAPDYLETRGHPTSIEDLAHHDCIVFARDGRHLPWQLPDAAGVTANIKIAPRHWISDGDALRDATCAGLGIAFLTTWLAAEDLRSGRLVPVLMSQPTGDEPIHVLWNRSRALAPKIRAAVDALVDGFDKMPPWERV